jgi:hypothetical protein
MATTNYSLITPTVGADLNTWGGDLNSNTEKLDDLLGGDQPITGIDINSGSIDGTPVGANSASTGAFTTVSASGGITGNLTGNVTGTVTGNVAGNALTATSAGKWTTARTISLTGTITGSTSMDGSGNVSIATSGGLTNAQVANIVYPAGCLYETTSTENPATTFGVGTWSLFGQGRVTVCIDTGQTEFNVNGETGGAKTHTLTEAEMPSHNHTLTAMALTSNSVNRTGGGQLSVSSTITTSTAGSDVAHNNLQPYIVVYRWKRVS